MILLRPKSVIFISPQHDPLPSRMLPRQQSQCYYYYNYYYYYYYYTAVIHDLTETKVSYLYFTTAWSTAQQYVAYTTVTVLLLQQLQQLLLLLHIAVIHDLT